MGCACIQHEAVKSKKSSVIKQELNQVNPVSSRSQNNVQSHIREVPVNEPSSNRGGGSQIRQIENPRSGQQVNNNRQVSQNRNINIQAFQVNQIPNQNIPITGEIYLQSKNNPNFNYPEVGKQYSIIL
jgi:hypothetical protein